MSFYLFLRKNNRSDLLPGYILPTFAFVFFKQSNMAIRKKLQVKTVKKIILIAF